MAVWRGIQPWITTLVRIGLAAVLGYSGISKALAPVMSAQTVEAYQLFPESIATVIGYALPFLEIALALLLLLGLATRSMGVASSVLFIVFVAGIASVWARGLSIDCGCFGGGGTVAEGQTHYLRDILRDIGFFAMAAWVAVWPRDKIGLDRFLLGAAGGGADQDHDEAADELRDDVEDGQHAAPPQAAKPEYREGTL